MYIFLKYDIINNIKGILIITHKELQYNNLLKYLDNIKINYYILVHNGSVLKPLNYDFITFNLSTETNCIYDNCLPFTSRNFLDNIYNNNKDDLIHIKFKNILEKYNLKFNYNLNKQNKIFDFICVNRSASIKLTYDLLKYIINYLKITNKTCCFIIIEYDINNPYYLEIMNYYNKNKIDNLLFINGIHLNKIKNSLWSGLLREELAILYKLSKIYMHCCEAEGESRTIHEALACGCMILAKNNMTGGGLDYLNESNSSLYNKNNYINKMNEILIKSEKYNYNYDLFKKINIVYSSYNFKKVLYEKLYKNSILSFEDFNEKCNIDNMMDKLPGHDISEPWYLINTLTADIRTEEQINIFSKYINMVENKKIYFPSENIHLLINKEILNKHPEGWYFESKHSSCIYNEKIKRDLVKKLIDTNFLNKEKNIIDGGCRFGDNTLPWAKLINGKIYGIDPSEKNIEIINNLAELNNIKNIETYKFGLSDCDDKLYTNGTLIHCVFQNNNNSNNYTPPHNITHGNIKKNTFIVDCYKIDTLYEKNKINNISLIHLDIEGFEMPVIFESKKTIINEKPIIIWENHTNVMNKKNNKYDYIEIKNFLNNLNYTTYIINEISGGNPSCRNFISIYNNNIDIFKKITDIYITNKIIEKI